MREILSNWDVRIIDTDIPNNESCHLFVSLAWHYKIGPLIWRTNKYVLDKIDDECFDLIWVDKAIYLTERTTKILRTRTKRLVHYTPDPAYTFHRSRLLFASFPYYDYVVTTKTYEINDFVKTNEYETFLLKSIDEGLSKIEKENDTCIGITKLDFERYNELITNKYNIKIKEIEEKYIGGCILENTNQGIFIDNTLLNRIDEKLKG